MLWMLLLLGGFAPADTTSDGRAVLRAMHDRYATTWYETLALVQAVTYFDPLGRVDHAEIWYKSLALPGRIRSDIAPLEDGRGEMFRADSIYRFEHDTVVQRDEAIHVVLLLAFDVYRQPASVTAGALERFGFDLSAVRDDTLDARPAWVVGADDGPRFWVDRDACLLRRLVVPGEDGGALQDIRFEDYTRLDGGWIAATTSFRTDGSLRVRERAVWWASGLPLDSTLFATTGRIPPAWVRN